MLCVFLGLVFLPRAPKGKEQPGLPAVVHLLRPAVTPHWWLPGFPNWGAGLLVAGVQDPFLDGPEYFGS
jgi:hypothetical protein